MSLSALSSRAIIGHYYLRLEGKVVMPWIDDVAVFYDQVDQESETYKMLGMTAPMREWKGARQPTKPRVEEFTIKNVPYESSMEIDCDDIRRDKTGQIMARVDDLADQGTRHWNKLLTTCIEDGESTACYDTKYFFGTDHVSGDSGTQSNDLTSSDYSALNVSDPTCPTADELATVILKMIQHLYTLKDDRGEPLNEDASQFLVYLPVPFAGAGWKAIYGNQLDTGSGTHDNPLKSAPWNISVAVNPRSSWTTKLAVFRTDSITKPFIRQQEAGTAPTVFVLGDDSEYCKVGNHWLVGTENTWRAVGYGVWQHACLGLLS